MKRVALSIAVLVLAVVTGGPAAQYIGYVIDAQTGKPIAGAIISTASHEWRTDQRGAFRTDDSAGDVVRVRAYGYRRSQIALERLRRRDAQLSLEPFRPKALYLSMFGVGNAALRGAALRLADTTEINALVIDVKGDRGLIAYRTADPLAAGVGAQKIITISDPRGLVEQLHARGLYTIARIVVFKDDRLASARPDLAVRRRDGSIYRDREGLAWADPFSRDVWSYNIGVAVDAARAGFDEIQFDYVRLPDAQGLAWPVQTEVGRRGAVEGFLRAARTALVPYNVFLAADVFGYICWNTNDTGIGQHLENMAGVVDYLSPMLYPSSFQFGIPGYRNPVLHPYDIVRRSIEEALRRTRAPAVRFRPWLQAFPDYAFGAGSFRNGEVRRQIDAADDVGTAGWMLWNPHNRYQASDLDAGD